MLAIFGGFLILYKSLLIVVLAPILTFRGKNLSALVDVRKKNNLQHIIITRFQSLPIST